MKLRSLLPNLLLASLSLPLPVTGSDAVHGHLLLNGGGKKPDDVMSKFVELAGGPTAQIVVIPTASSEADTGDYYRELLAEYGATNVTSLEIRSRDDAAQLHFVERLATANGIFFSGGDQRRITQTLLNTPAGEAIRAAYQSGSVVGGTSAGTACMSGLMITGDGEFDRITAHNVELWEGLGLFPGAILDQHFVARKRQNRLLAAVLEHPELLGIGVDEGTALWLRPDGTVQVLGEGSVLVYDARDREVHRHESRLGEGLGAHDLTVHLLLPGDEFDLTTARPARPKATEP